MKERSAMQGMPNVLVACLLALLLAAGSSWALNLEPPPQPRDLTVDKVLYRKGETLTFTAPKLAAGRKYRLLWVDSFSRVIRVTEFTADTVPYSGTVKIEHPTAIVNWLVIEDPDEKDDKKAAVAAAAFSVRPDQWWDEYWTLHYWDPGKNYHQNMAKGIFGSSTYGGDYVQYNMRKVPGEPHQGGLLYMKDEFGKKFNAPYQETRDRKYLIRVPCQNNPADVAKIGIFDAMRRGIGPRTSCPLGFDIRDELGYTSFVNPHDFCFCEFCMKKFRAFLQERMYKTLDALNAQWGTAFKTWDEVMPDTTDEAKMKHTPALKGRLVPGCQRFEIPSEEFSTPGEENFSAWADRLEFVDSFWAEFLDKCFAAAQERVPEAYVGFNGSQAPSAWGGYNWPYLLKKTRMSYVEAYDIGGSREILRSFTDRSRFRYCKTAFSGGPLGTYFIWYYFLRGDSGSILWIWDKAFQEVFHELHRGLGKLLITSDILADPVAIYFSQPSIRVHWMLDSEVDASTWPQRFGSWEVDHSSHMVARCSWMKTIEDLGLLYRFVDREDAMKGDLIKQGYKVLIMSKICTMSDGEAKAVREFVEQGGLVIADDMTGTFDEHGKRRKAGCLDDLFGIKRDNFIVSENNGEFLPEKCFIRAKKNRKWLDIAQSPVTLKQVEKWGHVTQDVDPKCFHIAEPGISLGEGGVALAECGGIPALVVREHGKGKTVYANISWLDYERKYRSSAEWDFGAGLRKLTGNLFALAGPKATFGVLDKATGREVYLCQRYRYRRGGLDFLGLVMNGRVIGDPLGTPRLAGLKLDKTFQVRVSLPEKRHVYDCRSGLYFGHTDSFEKEMLPVEGYIFALLPYQVTGLNVDVEDKYPYRFKARVVTQGKPGNHLVHMEVFDPRGVCRENYSLNLDAPDGAAEGEIPLCLNDSKGTWVAVFRDVVSGYEAVRKIEKKEISFEHIPTLDSYDDTGVVLDVRKAGGIETKEANGAKLLVLSIDVKREDKSYAEGRVLFSAGEWAVSRPEIPLSVFTRASERTMRLQITRKAEGGIRGALRCRLESVLEAAGKDPRKQIAEFMFVALTPGKAPVLDGELEDEGWKGAVRLDGFTSAAGRASALKSSAAFVVTGEDLFFSIVNELPKGKQPTVVTGRRDDGEMFAKDDSVRIEIRPEGGKGPPFVFGFNGRGKQYDALGENDGRNFKWDRKVKGEDGSWQAELRIPLNSFGAAVRKGEMMCWGFAIAVKRPSAHKEEQTAVLQGDLLLDLSK